MDFQIYNTLTRQKETFTPLVEGEVKIYSCGPTVYSDPHVGNLRYFTFCGLLGDVARYVLGYKTMHVMNITDVGHLTNDSDHGEDKMEKGSQREGISAWDIAKKYENNFLQYLQDLNIQFDAHPRATEYITEQIAIVKMLENTGVTYVIPGDGIYMDTSKIADYGKLLGPNYKEHLAGLESGSRVDDEGKINPTDFALWKFSPVGEQRQMEWIFAGERAGVLLDDNVRRTLTEEENASRGFPGWHIECSAMSRALLGDYFDIHTGGVDHIAVHHSDEIAQSETSFCSHTPWVRYWMHGQFLNINGTKVSKSAGDDLSIPGLREKGYDPLDVRYFFFTGKYSSFLDFTYETLDAAKTTRANLIKKVHAYIGDRIVNFYDVQQEDINNILYNQMIEPLLDDLDTPQFLTRIQKAIGSINDEVLKVILFLDKRVLKIGIYDGVMSLNNAASEQASLVVPENIQHLAQERREAKKAKDFVLADAIRNQLATQGWLVKDTSEGWEIEVLK